MSYLDIYNAVVSDGTTRARAVVAAAQYARHLLAQGSAVSADRSFWARQYLVSPLAGVDAILWGVAGDPAYQAAGSAITDAALQGAVEGAVNSMIPG
jgi:hypothetical protein